MVYRCSGCGLRKNDSLAPGTDCPCDSRTPITQCPTSRRGPSGIVLIQVVDDMWPNMSSQYATGQQTYSWQVNFTTYQSTAAISRILRELRNG